MVKISKETEDKLKQILPESHALDVDRQQTVMNPDNVLDPSNPDDIKKWADNTSHRDLKGFDTKDAKEKTQAQVLKAVHNTNYIEQDVDRFTDPRTVAGALLDKAKHKINDYASMKKVVEDEWSKDDSLKNFVDGNNYNLTKRDLDALFSSSLMQDAINNNTKPVMVNYLMKRFGVEPVRASRVLNHLDPQTRRKLYSQAQRSKLPRIRVPQLRQPRKNARKGVVSKTRWSQQELNIIKSNKELSPDKVFDLFRRNTSYKRSYSAVRNRLYRIRGE